MLIKSERLSSSPSTFSEAWEYAWEHQLSSLSKADYELKRYKKHLEPKIGRLKLHKITPIILEGIIAELSRKSYKAQTIHHILGLVRRTFNLLIRWNLYSQINPATQVKLPKSDNRRQRYLSKDEAVRLLSALKEKSETTWGLALLSLSTGMRLGEMLNLKGEHVNFHENTIKIVDTKSKRNRTVFLPDAALEMLKNLNPKAGQFVFKKSSGAPFKTLSDTYYRVVKQLGFNDDITDSRDKVVFHTLRHTFASWMTQDGGSVFLVSELLGHSSLEMTRRYSHMSPEKKLAATASINSRLSEYTQKDGDMQDNYVKLCIKEEIESLSARLHEFTQETHVILCNLVKSVANQQVYTVSHNIT
jgi:integrase